MISSSNHTNPIVCRRSRAPPSLFAGTVNWSSTNTSVRRTSSLSAPARMSVPQNGWTVTPSVWAGIRAKMVSG
ncbi:Uncharacterised protein [Mycobacteroides abscessus subsp. abscessus]|nr:Uncharacterised protein [Mycobacteroides abscessus subsp. abscessus]